MMLQHDPGFVVVKQTSTDGKFPDKHPLEYESKAKELEMDINT